MKSKSNGCSPVCSREAINAGVALLLTLVAGCATTGDPQQDTIFWSEKKAQGRLEERRAAIAEQTEALAQERAKGAALQAELEESQRKDDAIRASLRQAEADLAALIREHGATTGETENLGKQLSSAKKQLSEIHPNAAEVEEMKRKRAVLEAQVTEIQKRLRILMGNG